MKIFSSAAFIPVALTCVITAEAETSPIGRKLISDGEIVPAGTKTYNVGLHPAKGEGSFCGGSLISPTQVLTSPICFNTSIFPEARWVSVGSHKRHVKEDGEQIKIASIHNHPDVDTVLQENMFTVIELAKASSFTPVKLAKADDSDIKKNKWATSMGWGYTGNEGYQSEELRRVDVEIWSGKKCSQKYDVDETVLCAGGKKNEGICGADNGGPLVMESDTGGDSNDVLVGVAIGSEDCGNGYPGGYARVSSARDWLDQIISDETTD